MKVLCISANGKRLKVDVGSDQAILRPGEPVFVPEPVEEWRSSVAPAVRISRLGTAIKASSARAYYDSIAPVHLLTPADNSVADGLPPFVLDRALSPGKWTAPLNSDGTYTLTVSKGSIGSDSSENFARVHSRGPRHRQCYCGTLAPSHIPHRRHHCAAQPCHSTRDSRARHRNKSFS